MPIPEWLSTSDPRGKFIWGMVGAVAPEVMRLKIESSLELPVAHSPSSTAPTSSFDTWANCFIVGAFWPLVVTAFARQIKQWTV